MGRILVNWRITLASLFSVLLIAGAYSLARSIESPPTAQASTETELLQAIATRDSDGDSLPDWEEALYGTDPRTTDSFNLGMTDGEAVTKGLIVPKAIADIAVATSTAATSSTFDYAANGLPQPPAEGTLTAAFAQSFFTLYLAAKQSVGGADLTETQIHDVASQALRTLTATTVVAPDFKTAADLAVYGSGKDALIAFAVHAEAVLLKNTSDATTTPLRYLQYAVQGGDSSALAHITSIAKMYRGSAIGLAALPVPKELAAADLILINALMRMNQISSDFARVDTDPLAAILALQQYVGAVQALETAFTSIGKIYAAAGISLPTGASGASFVNMIVEVAADQQSKGKNP